MAIKKVSEKTGATQSISIKKTATKKVAAKQPVHQQKVKPTVAITTAKTEFSVKLPTNMSIRAREKALVLLKFFEQDFREPAQRIAYVSSFVFMALGSLVAVSLTFITPDERTLSATIVDTSGTLFNTVHTATNTATGGTTDTGGTSGASATTLTYASPVFTPAQSLPSILTTNFPYTFTVTDAKNVEARLYSFNDGQRISLDIESIDVDTYRAYIKYSALAPGEYKLRLLAESAHNLNKYNFDAGNFDIKTSLTKTVSGTVNETATTSTHTTDASETSEGETLTEDTAETETEEVIEPVESNVTEPKIIIDGGDFVKQEVVKVEVPDDTKQVELYVRPLNSINAWFLGSALEGTTVWYFFFDTLKVPNGEYELFARTRGSAAYLTSDARKIRVANLVASSLVKTTETTTTVKEPVATTETKPELEETNTEESQDTEAEEVVAATTDARSFSEIPLTEFSKEASSSEATSELQEEVTTVLDGYREELADLLKRYSVAQQSGDEVMIEIARKELLESKRVLVNDILKDGETNHLADDIERILTEQFDSLEKRVETFEQLRRSANTEQIGLDTDGDGISDFDEKNLYNTNAEQADTDSDGINDGIEIMRGFDPLNDAPEAVIEYEMPQETIALVQEETLKIETVVPIVQTDAEGGALPTFAEIKGKGLPNSFVTLYIFSTPTIVTVKTDNDGSFVYTFEKELEDGKHEVYVAVTDNTGAIMARSNPFSFIKEAQAFTPVDTSGAEVVSSESFSEFTAMNTYNVAVGLGILAFGLILLMLGVSLREKDEVVIKPAHDLKTS
jgi:hypothetical protein